MPKEKNYNPVQATKKAEKQKQLKKQKAQVQAQRNERLANRNPQRLERDIEELKALQASGDIRPHDRQRLAQLEKDVSAIKKAREALGDKAPQFKSERRDDGDKGARGGRGRGGGVLGKRLRDGSRKEDSSDTDNDVKDIPMPRDTPPPIPRRRRPDGTEEALPEPKKAQIVYEAPAQVRDLKKEATKFIPAAVREKMKLAQGKGRLLEPEELDKLEQEGYRDAEKAANAAADEVQHAVQANEEADDIDAFLKGAEADFEVSETPANAGIQDSIREVVDAAEKEAEYNMMAEEAEGKLAGSIAKESAAERHLHQVEIEEVEDEDI